MAKSEERQVRCNFCGKKQSEVQRLIAGNGAFICDECIALCAGDVYKRQHGCRPFGRVPRWKTGQNYA